MGCYIEAWKFKREWLVSRCFEQSLSFFTCIPKFLHASSQGSSTFVPLMPISSPRREAKYNDNSAFMISIPTHSVRSLSRVKCERSPASLKPYSGRRSSKNSSEFISNSGAGFSMKTQRERGSVDCKHANLTSIGHTWNQCAEDEAKSNRAEDACRVCALWTRKGFSLSFCPPMTYRALYFICPAALDFIAKKKRAVSALAPSGSSDLSRTWTFPSLRGHEPHFLWPISSLAPRRVDHFYLLLRWHMSWLVATCVRMRTKLVECEEVWIRRGIRLRKRFQLDLVI